MEHLGFFERAVNVVDKYGSWKVFQTIMYLGLFSFMVMYIPAVTKATVEKSTLESIQTAEHARELAHVKQLELRKEIQPQVNATLDMILNSARADRAFIIELHNGSNNLNGVPFLHGSVTYERVKDGVTSIDEEYQNVSLTRYNLASYLHTNYSFVGSIPTLEKVDRKMATKLAMDDTKYVAMITLHNGINEWGWFGVLYNRDTDIPTDIELMNELMITSQTITKILTVFNK